MYPLKQSCMFIESVCLFTGQTHLFPNQCVISSKSCIPSEVAFRISALRACILNGGAKTIEFQSRASDNNNPRHLLVLASFTMWSPKGWPIIGNMMMMDKLTHRGLTKLAQKYGGILHLKMGYVHMSVVASPAEDRQVLQLQDTVFANRPTTIAVRYLSYDLADMALANYGPFWRQMRKLCVMKLFSRRRAESWDSVHDEVDAMTRVVDTSSGSSVNIGELVFGLAKNSTYRYTWQMSRFCQINKQIIIHPVKVCMS
ncbi:Cytochrome 84A4 [Capsicum baccatum]|uniref:Cytochrome 84A4 n=1 Tax=Capsicum baccatum TaxID=33114 RepID=A0A2G2WWZ8_CAPBA|nr:Cytochrome 84A4 [Capsicum baccatum]